VRARAAVAAILIYFPGSFLGGAASAGIGPADIVAWAICQSDCRSLPGLR
jgi:hypothetical protein